MAFKNGVVIVMSCSKGGINKVLPLAGFCPDSQNIHSDGAKIRCFSITSKFFAIILCFRPLFCLEIQKLFVLLHYSKNFVSMLFQKTIIKKYLGLLNDEVVNEAWNKFQAYFLDVQIQANIQQSKEEQFQEGFLRELFVKVLGYTLNPSPNFNLITEKKNETNSKKADGAIQKDGKVIGVIELKDHKTTDLSRIEAQAFGYKSQHRDTRLVVISNFEKLRLYIDNAVDYDAGIAIQMKQESVSSEDQITKALYRDYSEFKRVLFADIIANNPVEDGADEKEWQLLLFKKTQKLLDRLLFIFFAEDCGLLQPNSMVQIIDKWQTLKDLDAYVPLYDRVKQYFGYLDKGHQGKPFDVFAYNGGLFKTDNVLDKLQISDDLLATHTRKLSTYDFESDVDVNILGHIFENSLSEIEEVTQQINSGETPQTSKRKQDGVFYTPQYITKYIVENTVGRLCSEKKHDLGIVEEEYFSDQRRQLKTKQRLLDQLQKYREWLLQITILDPACGSGAFLNAALQFLMAEHKLIDEMEAKVAGSAIVFQDVENSILEHNLYGVDINEESVEIAQLALWLRTARPNRKLNSLNENIKCGNSLISDPAIAGDKAFNWQEQFPMVFEKGGFDVVIGNPPYVRVQNLKQSEVDHYFNSYDTPSGKLDISILFFERGYSLINEKGLLSFISTSQWMQTDYGKNIRLFLSDGKLNRILDFGSLPVFEDADTYPAIFSLSKTKNNSISYARVKSKDDLTIEKLRICQFKDYECESFSSKAWQFSDFDLIHSLIKKNIKFKLLKDIAPSFIGDLTGKDEAFVLKKIDAESLGLENDILYPYAYRGEEVSSYCMVSPQSVVIYPYHQSGELFEEEFFKNNYPNAYNYLLPMKEELMMRQDSRKNYATESNWYRHLRAGKFSYIFPKKILLKGIGTHLQAGLLDGRSIFNGANVPAIVLPDSNSIDKVLLCLLNSKLITYYLTCICPKKLSGYYRFNSSNISSIPIIFPLDQYFFIELADTMLSLNSQLQEKRSRFLRRVSENFEGIKITTALQTFDQLEFKGFVTELKKQKIKLSLVQQDEWEEYFNQYREACQELSEQIKATDNEIDERVFDLYGLTPEEREIVLKLQ